MSTRISLIFACVAAGSALLSAQERPSINASLDAVEVATHIRLHKEGAEVRFTVDEDIADKSGARLEKNQVFVTRKPLKVTYQEFNPLLIAASVKVKSVENASAALLSELLQAVTSVGGVVKPTSGAAGAASALISGVDAGAPANAAACQPEVDRALSSVRVLDDTLFHEMVSANEVSSEYRKWADAIAQAFRSGKDGQSAMEDGAKAVSSYSSRLKSKLDIAAVEIGVVDKGAAESPTDRCRQLAVAVYQFIRLTSPHVRLAQLRSLNKAVSDLEKKLNDMKVTGQWIGRDYVLAKDIIVTAEMDADVSIELNDLSIESVEGALSVKRGDVVSAAITVQMDTGWVLEPSAGLTAGYVTRPKFGTAKDTAGKTIVAQLKDDRVSVDPSIMVNLISRRGTALLRPLVQLGASAAKDAPAVFVGLGWRVFGAKKAGLAIGGGLMLAWVKDLATLEPGQEVEGTKQIEADFKFDWARPKPRLYWSLQYKF